MPEAAMRIMGDVRQCVRTAMTLGIPNGWIMLGRNISEGKGMLEMAEASES
jgi:hypothetical protein